MAAAIVAAYFIALPFMDGPKPEQQAEPTEKEAAQPQKPADPVQPWYQKQSPPPEMITTPDLPLFPDPVDEQAEPVETARAYEEALPKETYEEPAAPLFKPGHSKPVQPVKPAPVPAVDPVTRPQTEPEPVIEPSKAPEIASIAGVPRWRQFAVPHPVSGEEPLIAIVIDDMGVDQRRSAQAIDLNGPLTLSFLTYARDIVKQTDRARGNGHELMLHVAMEPGSKSVDPGPNALLTELDEDELRRRLEWGFQRFNTYVGINNHMGSKFTADAKSMRVVIEEVKRRGLLFLDSRTSNKTVGAKLAREMGVPVAERNIFLDHENTVEAVNSQLKHVEKLALRNGAVIAIGHPRDATIKALKVWLKTIEEKGFKLVPLSTIVSFGATY